MQKFSWAIRNPESVGRHTFLFMQFSDIKNSRNSDILFDQFFDKFIAFMHIAVSIQIRNNQIVIGIFNQKKCMFKFNKRLRTNLKKESFISNYYD